MVFAHAFVGGLTTYYSLKSNKKLKFSDFGLSIIWFFGVLGSIFPDFDLALLYINKDLEHRKLLTHSIIFYLSLFIVVNVVTYFFKLKQDKKNLILMTNLVFFLGVFSHLIIDFFVGGLVLLAPFTYYYFGYDLPFHGKSGDWSAYFFSTYMVAESIITFWFIEVRKNISNFVGRYISFFWFLISVILTFIILYFK